MGPLMDVPTLEARLASGHRTVLLDVRWALGDPHGREHYLEAHLPGAVFVDLATELAAPAAPERGRHPLPPTPEFQASARRWGINNGDVVVAYDNSGNMAAARAWWMLRNAGFPEVYLLDGGLAAWQDAGLPLESGNGDAVPGNVALTEGGMPAIDGAAAADWAQTGILLDARAGERYRGEFEPVDPRAGHLPGALSAPTTENVDGSGRFLPASELRRRFENLGVGDNVPVAVYCGSGVTAAHEVAALEIAGFRAALYPGSFSEWSNNPALPVATGSTPGTPAGQ
ncbi:sulfurtransferase [Pseudarthrobacter sulfonivorans]|uniref:sulfurtransferase n=1 Tax=Pseudarthrobacter sulfonivorans TaxID=121292 RepID=UPI002860BD11|nr:sulfurtransferase [Pseudarthrobacter sulfonivorans]MDR6413891.1 thiosulfate/3-mercaptopyruvate sulfurtransferase [Pseudarthrobacter sulfonivorans]